MDLEILKIASETHNCKQIKHFTHFSKLKNPLCGDEIQIQLIIEKDKIIDFGYQGKSCVYCQASASLLSKLSINETKNQIIKLCNESKSFFENNFQNEKKEWSILNKIFKKENLARKECILLPFKTLKKIVSS
tara:strand:- start:138 stop:536 length:399 start_codon:yes stop_codon:yes gene_type:complete